MPYNYDDVIKNINALADRGYIFIGNLSSDFKPWPTVKLGRFLFIKNNIYYQYSATSLLYGSILDIYFDTNNEPLLGQKFQKIVSQDYIYLIFRQEELTDKKPDEFVLLRENASLSGHSFLIGPYKEKKGTITAGEIYYYNSRIFLVDPKSSNFPRKPDEVISVVKRIWGQEGVDAFYPGIEKDDVDRELLRRKKIITTSSPDSFSRPILPAPDTSMPITLSPLVGRVPVFLETSLSLDPASSSSIVFNQKSTVTLEASSSEAHTQVLPGALEESPSLAPSTRAQLAALSQRTPMTYTPSHSLAPTESSSTTLSQRTSGTHTADPSVASSLASTASPSIINDQKLFNTRAKTTKASTNPPQDGCCVIL